MPIFQLAVRNGAPADLLRSSPHRGPVIVDASDEVMARVIAKTNFWTMLRDTDGFPRLDCIWTDQRWVYCEAISPAAVAFDRDPRADPNTVTCPEFRFANGRYARLVLWPADEADTAYRH